MFVAFLQVLTVLYRSRQFRIHIECVYIFYLGRPPNHVRMLDDLCFFQSNW